MRDLLPLPHADEAVHWVSARIRQVQETLERTILIEKVSSYMRFVHSTMSEWQFLTAVAEESDCGILLDINNVFVSALNHRFDPRTYIESVPIKRVAQYHLAGHSDRGSYLLDTHDHLIAAEVRALRELAASRFGEVSALIEWDDHIPEFSILEAATHEARTRHRAAARERSVRVGVCESA